MKVLVTGATGHVGLALVSELVDAGYQVRAGVRRLDDDFRVERLRALGVELFVADILSPLSMAEACSGVDGVFHVAAVVRMWARDPEREILAPNVEGVRTVLRAAAEAGVRRVVLTSSIAAVGVGTPEGVELGPEDWHHAALTPYSRAKTLAELHAWAEVGRSGVDLVTVCPGSVIGPGFFRHTPSTELFSWLERGLLRAVLPLQTAYVDCRSLAYIHRAAFERGTAGSRYLAVDATLTMDEIAAIASQVDPRIPRPSLRMPKSLLPLLAAGDALGSAVTGGDRRITMHVVREFSGLKVTYDVSRTIEDLGWRPMDPVRSVEDTLAWLKAHCFEA